LVCCFAFLSDCRFSGPDVVGAFQKKNVRLGSQIHPSYYGHHIGGYGAPNVLLHSSVAAAPVIHDAPVIHAPLYSSRYLTKGGYCSKSHYYGHHIGGYGAPIVHSSVAAAPVIYGSHSGIYGSSVAAAPVIRSMVSTAAFTALLLLPPPSSMVCFHSGIYGSRYLSRKHLKRAIKYGSYYGGDAGFSGIF
jgi:hypothetical protein